MSDENMNNEIPQEFEENEQLEDDFEDDFEESEPIVDPTQVIAMRTTSGDTRYIPATGPMSLAQVKALSGLTFGAVTFYLNAAVIDDATVIPVGSTVSAIGNVKGGC